MRIIYSVLIVFSLFSVAANADENYIPWTFDDLDENVELVESQKEFSEKELTIEYGELGW